MHNHTPQTFEEWWSTGLWQKANSPKEIATAAFAAGVASQQAEIERLKATNDDLSGRVSLAELEIERLHRTAGVAWQLARYEAVVEAARKRTRAPMWIPLDTEEDRGRWFALLRDYMDSEAALRAALDALDQST